MDGVVGVVGVAGEGCQAQVGTGAQCPQGKGTELGDGDKAAWGRSSHHAWGWQWLQEGLLEVQVLPTGSRPCLCPLVGGGHQGLWGRQPGLGTPALGSGPAQVGSACSSSHTEWTEPRGKGGFGERVLSSCQPLGWAVGGTLAPWAGLAGGQLVLWGLARQWGGPGSAPWGVGRGAWAWRGRCGGRQPAVSWAHLPAAPGSPSGHALWGRRPGPPVSLWPEGPQDPGEARSAGTGAVSRRPGLRAPFMKAISTQAHGVRVHLWVFPKWGAPVLSVERVVLSAGQGQPHLGPSLTHSCPSLCARLPASPGHAPTLTLSVFFSPQPGPFGRHLPG